MANKRMRKPKEVRAQDGRVIAYEERRGAYFIARDTDKRERGRWKKLASGVFQLVTPRAEINAARARPVLSPSQKQALERAELAGDLEAPEFSTARLLLAMERARGKTRKVPAWWLVERAAEIEASAEYAAAAGKAAHLETTLMEMAFAEGYIQEGETLGRKDVDNAWAAIDREQVKWEEARRS